MTYDAPLGRPAHLILLVLRGLFEILFWVIFLTQIVGTILVHHRGWKILYGLLAVACGLLAMLLNRTTFARGELSRMFNVKKHFYDFVKLNY